MQRARKRHQNRREEIIEIVKTNPGITSAEIASKLGLPNSTRASTAIWPAVQRGQIVAERISRDGQTMNAHYHPDQVPPDAVERVQQRLVDASEVIPISKAAGARSSVFDVPSARTPRGSKKQAPRKASSPPSIASPQAHKPQQTASRNFACAITSDGSLVLMRAGEIQFSLSDVEAATLQSYLVKRAAANLFASMA